MVCLIVAFPSLHENLSTFQENISKMRKTRQSMFWISGLYKEVLFGTLTSLSVEVASESASRPNSFTPSSTAALKVFHIAWTDVVQQVNIRPINAVLRRALPAFAES